MSFAPAQNTRYPRPLKATHLFQQESSSDATLGTSSSIPPSNPYSLSPAFNSLGQDGCQYYTSNQLSEKRSNSLSSLSDSDISGKSHHHTRSNSLSNNQAACVEDLTTPTQIHPTQQVPVGFSRFSIEGLNQEVSTALEGKSLSFQYSHPDGHIAPVNEIKGGGVTRITVTTPINAYSSPSLTSTSPPTCDDLSTHINSLHLHRNSPAAMLRDLHSPGSYPSSPKSSFNHKPSPPDGALSVHTKIFYPGDGLSLEGPDRSKGNIEFNGSVFSPPPHHSIGAVATR